MGKKSEDFKYEIKEILGIASPQEDTKSVWVKAVLETLMGDNKEVGIDIRNYNIDHERMKNGVRLTPQEANRVCDILMEHGYGSLEVMEEQLSKRKGIFLAEG